jgi:hypothetical protein
MFYPLSSKPIKIEDCAWAVNEQRLINIPSTIAMNNVPEHKRFKISMVVKDKDLSLLNATVTDTVVPTRQKVIHINCFAHAMMHLDKCAPGCLDQRECLRFALMWLKRIDEGNKVCVCVVCLASCLALHSPRTRTLSPVAHGMKFQSCRAHRVLFCCAQPTHLNKVACGPWHDISVVPGPSRLVLSCRAHRVLFCCVVHSPRT